ncbi:MAG TPA: hypothetical protein PK537_03485 [Candidatus Limiplasma sp.]|nr:hypothetical protein [Candidatus Limiplasma sp.]
MLRETSLLHEQDWAEKTLSILREKQFEACERRLSNQLNFNLFSPLATDTYAQRLFEQSYFADELPADRLMTIETLRAKVIALLPHEAHYLSSAENALLEQLLLAGGRLTSKNWEEIPAAEALAGRLWCSFSSEGETWTLELAAELRDPLIKAFSAKKHAGARTRTFRYDVTIHGLLYITGFLPALQPRDIFQKEVLKTDAAWGRIVADRYLKAGFEYIKDEKNEIILLHPALADPYRLLWTLGGRINTAITLTEDALLGGMNGMLAEEAPLHERMQSALLGNMRPEWRADEAADDLRFLVKQNVSYQELEDVMSSMLCIRPTEEMHDALKNLYNNTPRWIAMSANLLH